MVRERQLHISKGDGEESVNERLITLKQEVNRLTNEI